MTQNRLKKYGKMQFTCSKKEQVQEVDLKNDAVFQSAKEVTRALFAEIDMEASNAKRLQELKNEVDAIIDELIPTLKKLSDLRKKMNQ